MLNSVCRFPVSTRVRELARWPDSVLMLALAPATLLNALSTLRSGEALLHPPCLITLLTGHQCPGCGLTRALTHLWLGHFQKAMELNPLSPLALCLVLFLFAQQLGKLVIYQRENFASYQPRWGRSQENHG